MQTLVTVGLGFEAAHKLYINNKPEEINDQWYGKCKNIHGHNYKLFVTIEGNINENGMVVNFAYVKKIVEEKVIELFDHKMINDLMEEVPTAENMCMLFWKKLETEFKSIGANLFEIRLYETDNSYVVLKK